VGVLNVSLVALQSSWYKQIELSSIVRSISKGRLSNEMLRTNICFVVSKGKWVYWKELKLFTNTNEFNSFAE